MTPEELQPLFDKLEDAIARRTDPLHAGVDVAIKQVAQELALEILKEDPRMRERLRGWIREEFAGWLLSEKEHRAVAKQQEKDNAE